MTIRQILEELANNCYSEGQGKRNTTIAIEVDSALAQIKEVLEGKKVKTDDWLCDKCYNQAIDDVIKEL